MPLHSGVSLNPFFNLDDLTYLPYVRHPPQLRRNPSPSLFVRRLLPPSLTPVVWIDGFRFATVESAIFDGVSALPVSPVDLGLNIYVDEGFVSLDVVVVCLQAPNPAFRRPILIRQTCGVLLRGGSWWVFLRRVNFFIVLVRILATLDSLSCLVDVLFNLLSFLHYGFSTLILCPQLFGDFCVPKMVQSSF